MHVTRGEDHAHQQPSLTRKKLRRLEITAGAPNNTRRAAGIWSTNDPVRVAEREPAEQAELSYKRMVQDQQAGGPARKAGASVTPERALNKALERQVTRQATVELLTPAL